MAKVPSVDRDDTGPPSGNDGASRRRFYFDQRLNSLIVWVSEGEFYVSTSPFEMLSTVLGSCIAVCIRDPISGCGGMNHFLLPAKSTHTPDPSSADLRFGSYSIERLVNALIARGARRDRLEVKVFGGANMRIGAGSNHGHANADFVESYLERERLKVVASCLRGTAARRVRYHAATGRAQARVVTGTASTSILATEAQLANRLPGTVSNKRVEIFDPLFRAGV